MQTLQNFIVTETCHVLGLGPTLNDYKEADETTIGVNDIWRFRHSDYVVCVDPPNRWEPERKLGILMAKPRAFFTQYPSWKPLVHNYFPITLAKGCGFTSELDSERICKSTNSAYVAAVIAYKLGAKKIILWGVDLNGHQNLGRQNMLNISIKHFINLRNELKARGVELKVGSKNSFMYSALHPL